MRVLVVEADGALARLIGDLLEGDGQQLRFAADGREALRMVERGDGQALLVDLDLPDVPGLELLRVMHRRGVLDDAPVVVGLVSELTAQLQAEADGLGVARIFPKPPSLLDLTDLLRRPPGPGRPAVADGFVPETAAKLASWWARHRTGVIHAEGPDGSSWVLICDGGPVGADARPPLADALAGGRVEMEPCAVDGEGDRAWLGNLLWTRARAWAAEREAGKLAMVDVCPVDLTEAALDLPIRGATRAALRHLRAPVSGWTLVDALRADPHELEADLRALAALELVAIRPSTEVEPPRSRGPKGGSDYPTPPAFLDELSKGQDLPVPAREPPLPPPVSRSPPVPAPPVRTDAPPRRAVPAATEPCAPALSPAELVRLRREADLLGRSDPWTVLALPRGSEPPMVHAAVARMEARYEPLLGAANDEVRELAERILGRVRAAAQSVDQPAAYALHPADPGLDRAIAALDRGDWSGADRLLGAAREANPDSAEVLAHLGWARSHLSGYPEDEGPALLELAVTLDPGCTDAHVYLAELDARNGDGEAALRRLKRALGRNPRHPRGQALYRRLRPAS